MRIISCCLFLYVQLCAVAGFAQDKISLLNSKEIVNIKVVDITANTIQYQIVGIENPKTKSIYRDNVFAITYLDGTEKIIYLPEPTDDGEYSIEQMRMFIKGTKDAREKYYSFFPVVAGFAFGVAGPYAASYTFGSLVALPPVLGVFAMSLGSPNMKKQKVDPRFLANEEYQMGFQHRARKKRIKSSFLSSLVGVGVGFLLIGTK